MATNFDFTPYATGGAAARPDSFTGLADPFSQALVRMLQDAPAEVKIAITSAYRSPETQERLWNEALEKYGSAEAADNWVAPPGRSQHNHGNAADLKFLSPEAKAWVHENAGRYGLHFPLANEDWHIELATARGQSSPSMPTGNALGGGNALSSMGMPNAIAAQGNALATREAPRWVRPLAPQVQFTPLAMPTRRRA